MDPDGLIVFAGGIFRDLVTTTERFPKPGETLFGSDFFMGFGGKSSNQAVMCRKMGGHVAMVGKLGQDDHGRAYRDNYVSLGIDIRHLGSVEGCSSGIASIFVNTQSGENQIIIVAGANGRMGATDIREARPVFEKARVVVCALEMNMSAIKAALKAGKEHGATTILNAAPAKSDLDPEILSSTDILCVNESEAEILTSLPVTSLEEVKEACCTLLNHCPTVIITIGARGAVFAVRDQTQTPVHVPVTEASQTVVDTTGAGDAFVGALAFFLQNFPQLSLEETIRRSCCIASMTVHKSGTQASYPMASEISPALLL
eukprot:maker-scaffold160_size295910-snap-gene-1.42 protein:Tk01235 transcript:maker-scaffold160_size295910-snap-gene-1.42-mRNA-1 annotation:"ribokinase isoform x1"